MALKGFRSILVSCRKHMENDPANHPCPLHHHRFLIVESYFRLTVQLWHVSRTCVYLIQWWGFLARKKSELKRINTIIKTYLQHRTGQK